MNPIASLRAKFLDDFKRLLNESAFDVEDDATFSSIISAATMFVSQKTIAEKTQFGKASINRWSRGKQLTRNMRIRHMVAEDIKEIIRVIRK